PLSLSLSLPPSLSRSLSLSLPPSLSALHIITDTHLSHSTLTPSHSTLPVPFTLLLILTSLTLSHSTLTPLSQCPTYYSLILSHQQNRRLKMFCFKCDWEDERVNVTECGFSGDLWVNRCYVRSGRISVPRTA